MAHGLLGHYQAAGFSRLRWFLRRCERREGSGFGDLECFSHSLVTAWEKVQKYSSEKQVIGEDENEGRLQTKPRQRSKLGQNCKGTEIKTGGLLDAVEPTKGLKQSCDIVIAVKSSN